jgi:hypothetical protein
MKNKGAGSKKVGRQIRAKARAEEFAKLSTEAQKERKAQNKSDYDLTHQS